MALRSIIWFCSTSHVAAFFDLSANAPRRFAALGGDQGDFLIVIRVHGFDFFLIGDPFQDEMFLKGPGRGDRAVLAEFVFVGADVVVVETAAFQFHNRPLQFAVALPLREGRGQFPVRGFGQGGGDLLPGPATLLVFQLAAELILDGVAEIGLEFETP